ncbi:hypothetical protein WSTR_00480 [Wolbachia endosymbiont of Laodelphax striatellus]|uniref:hypothetical protein n=2 Tax=Wolbachia TaxID=953 RepID=UPI0007C4C4A3|nr:hypothetical protein [Wolbachia endosymbiont of Laodelphax striatellus]OAB82448.1 hypothetical protein WSTR_00480 [Wolbachia endosymbiont of Laodelphax striatellus]
MSNIEKLPMEYYIEKRKWEQTFEFLKGVKGIHSKNEKKLRIFMEAVCGVAVSGVFCQKFTAIRGVYIGGLKSGVKRKFWQNICNKIQI